jgi:dTDP-4-amino-4,6-dideoxygalactose transaminase
MFAHGAERAAVPMTRLDNGDPELLDELLGAVERVARQSAFTLGPEVQGFEEEFAAYCGSRHAIGLSSGTDALVLALRALDVGPGDEVVVPANSFIATAEAVTLVGARPRFADVDPETALLTADLIEPVLGPRTRCIMPVHLYGRTVDLQPILELSRKIGATVVEDACQAHGALLAGRRAGTVGVCGAFSFYPAKNLGAWGDGGALVTDDPAIADRVRLLRSHGERPRYHHRIPGTTARLDAIQAAILRVKLRRLDGWNDDRRRIAGVLTTALHGAPVRVPAPITADGDHVFHQYVVRAAARDSLREHLAGHGIATAIHYPVPLHRTAAYATGVAKNGVAPAAEALAESSLSLPMHPGLTPSEVERIAAAVHSFFEVT